MKSRHCAIQGCETYYRDNGGSPYSLFGVEKGDDEWSTKWREKVYAIVKKYREMDKTLRELIETRNLCVCELHYEAKCIRHRKFSH